MTSSPSSQTAMMAFMQACLAPEEMQTSAGS